MKKQASLTLKTEQSEELVERLLPAPPSDSASAVLALVERAAIDPRADVEKLERMMAMYERLKAKEAELAYNAAKGRILKKLARIKIARTNPLYTKSRRESLKGAPSKPSNTPPWRRSINICARYWRKRI
jgi:hypothetical protein